jgi:hypothetical protein
VVGAVGGAVVGRAHRAHIAHRVRRVRRINWARGVHRVNSFRKGGPYGLRGQFFR